MVDTLLWQWRQYMESPEYTQERDRARPDRTERSKQSEVNAKVKVHSLRHQVLRPIRCAAKNLHGKASLVSAQVPAFDAVEHLPIRWIDDCNVWRNGTHNKITQIYVAKQIQKKIFRHFSRVITAAGNIRRFIDTFVHPAKL